MIASEEIKKIIASRLLLARQQAGLPQVQVAKLVNLPRPAIAEIEACRRKVAAEELVRFSEIYKVGIEWLSGQNEDQVDSLRDKIQLAARNMAKMKPEDLEKVIVLLTSLKPEGDNH